MKIGIDGIGLYIPQLTFNFPKEFCENRKQEKEKINKGLGIYEFRIPDYNQDPVVLGANAIIKLIENNNYNPEDIKAIRVATESGIDESKPIGTYILGILEEIYGNSFSHVETDEMKFACIAGSFQLRNAVNSIKCREDKNAIEIVLTTDIALYEKRDPGEVTQGAGAVALGIKEKPRILDLSEISKNFVVSTSDEYDFFKPDGRKTPIVDGKGSINCYLERMKDAYDNFKKIYKKSHSEVDGKSPLEIFDRFVFHIPFPKMAEKAFSQLLIHEMRNKPEFSKIEKEIGKEPSKDSKEYYGWIKNFMETEYYKKSFEKKVKPSIEASQHIGNIYTGSIFLGLASLLEKENDISEEKIAFGGYGSGASACAYYGIVQNEYKDAIKNISLFSQIKEGQEINFEEYEKLHDWHIKAHDNIIISKQMYKRPYEISLKEINNGKRIYNIKHQRIKQVNL
ncbi:MAG: hypothetical protein KQA40_01575 [Candidatus Aenigmarchaeota archaeon]|nr:hypothetical protein [Candidatus Aenigmarchaeota archaeon]